MGWLYEVLVTESRWIAPSIALAGILAYRALRGSEVEGSHRVAAALSVYAGAMVGTMAFGHMLAVSLKLAAGELNGSPPLLFGIGIVLAMPAWLVARHGWALGRGRTRPGGETIAVNLLLVVALLATGPVTAPLAVPALLNVVHAGARRALVKQGAVVLAVVFGVLLFAGSVRFFVSGQPFEDFRPIDTQSR